jgi:hypothetical protein
MLFLKIVIAKNDTVVKIVFDNDYAVNLQSLNRKMYYKLLFLFCMYCLSTTNAYCQKKLVLPNTILVFKPIQIFSCKDTVAKKTISPSMLVSPTFYCDNLGFFCKQEIKIQKFIKFPFKFRLGSVQYVDYLEGKAGSLFLPNR